MFIEDVLKEWKNTAEELLDHNRRNIDDADDTSMLENKNIASKLEYQKKHLKGKESNLEWNLLWLDSYFYVEKSFFTK